MPVRHLRESPASALRRLKTVDGSGSGLDADLLDGADADDIDDGATPLDNYYLSAPGANDQTTTGVYVNREAVIPIKLARAKTFTRIGIEVVTAQASFARLGIREADADGLPGALVLDAGEVDLGTTGLKEITIDQTLARGTHFLVVNFSVGTTLRIRSMARSAIFGRFGASTPAGMATTGHYFRSEATTYGPFPTNFPGPVGSASGSMIIAWLRRVP